jgi:hypothetical protein
MTTTPLREKLRPRPRPSLPANGKKSPGCGARCAVCVRTLPVIGS